MAKYAYHYIKGDYGHPFKTGANLMRLGLGLPEVEEYVAGLKEVEEHLSEALAGGHAGVG